MEDIIKTILVGALTVITIVVVLYALNCIVEWWEERTKSGMRVIKKGKIPTKRVECLHCHSIIEYDTLVVEHQPIMDKFYPYIVCPVCNEQIMLGREEGDEQ